MEQNNRSEVIVGSFVIGLAAWFLIYAAGFIGSGATGAGGTTLFASFRSANGISVGTDVRIAGVKVGTVTDVTLDAKDFRATTEISLNRSYDIPDDSAILVSSEGLLGGNYIEILPGGSAFNFEDGGRFEDTQGAVSLINLLMKFVGGSSE